VFLGPIVGGALAIIANKIVIAMVIITVIVALSSVS